MNDKEKKNAKSAKTIIFLLGAGASVPAGVPDTRKFIYGKSKEGMEGFKEYIDKRGNENEKKVLERLLEKLEANLTPLLGSTTGISWSIERIER